MADLLDNQQPLAADDPKRAHRNRKKDTSATGPNSGVMLAAGKEPPKPYYDVDPESGCWTWNRPLTTAGYGSVRYVGKTRSAHRVYYAHYIGPVPHNRVVMHTCDRPSCVNPAHLRLGTQAENIADRHAKGRAKGWVNEGHKGSSRPNAKLDENKVRVIKQRIADGDGNRQIADDYGVTLATIWQIKVGRTWTHVE